MLHIAFLIFAYITEALIVYTFAKSLYEAKRSNAFSCFVVLLCYLVLLVLYSTVTKNELFNTFLIIFTNIFIVFGLFQCSFKSALFHGFSLGIAQLFSEFIAVYLFAWILGTQSENIVDEHFEIGVTLSRIIYLLLSRLLVLLSIKETKAKSWGKWFGLALLPLSSILILITFRLITNQVQLTSVDNTFLVISVSVLLLVNIIIYLIYERSEKNNQKLIELEITNQKNEIDLQYLTLLEKKNEAMKIMAHDYKRHMMTLEAMSDAPEIKSYIHEILGEIEQFSQIGKTKNKLLDVILGKYSDICREKSIRFETDIMSDNLNFIQGADISAMFNNLLDNAVEAAEQSLEKYIRVEISNSLHAYHIIKICNSCDRPPNTKNGRLLTTKANQDTHGFGFKSIQKAVNNYNGESQWSYDAENKQFSITIAMPIDQ